MPGLLDQFAIYVVNSHFDTHSRDFVPEGIIDRFVVSEAVWTELGLTEHTEKNENLIRYIVESAKILFVITLEVLGKSDLVWAMESFQYYKFTDGNLPFIDEEPGPGYPTSESFGRALSKIDRDGDVWSAARRRGFHNLQWKYLAPVFSTATKSYEFPADTVLPFIFKDNMVKEGGFGQVWQVKIHDEHLRDPKNKLGGMPNALAIKQIMPKNQEHKKDAARLWEREVGNLWRVAEYKHNHIVRFVTSFTRGSDYYLICEWADGGNLSDRWSNIERRGLSPDLVEEAVVQLHGLAAAIDLAHYGDFAYVRHTDLKPENILCFLGQGVFGTLKIADWGIAKEKIIATRFQMHKTTAGRASLLYEAPEVTLGFPGPMHGKYRILSRLGDMWSMGCIVLEFIVWLVDGNGTLREFHRRVGQRNLSYYIAQEGDSLDTKQGARVRDEVISEMDRLAATPACGQGTALGKLLEIVRNRLLVVRLPKQLGYRKRSSVSLEPPQQDEFTLKSRSSSFGEGNIPQFEDVQPSTDHGELPLAGGVSIQIDAPGETSGRSPVEAVGDEDEEEEEDLKLCRAYATELKEELENIISEGRRNGSYWLPSETEVSFPTKKVDANTELESQGTDNYGPSSSRGPGFISSSEGSRVPGLYSGSTPTGDTGTTAVSTPSYTGLQPESNYLVPVKYDAIVGRVIAPQTQIKSSNRGEDSE